MDAIITRGKPETFEDEEYRGYRITYNKQGGIFYVIKPGEYCRGVSSARQQAKRWIDLHIEGVVK